MRLFTTLRVRNDERQTWSSLLLGVIVWFLCFNVVYGLESVACRWGWFPFTVAGIPGLRVVQLLITLLSMLLLLLYIYLPWREWRKFQTAKPRDNPHMLR